MGVGILVFLSRYGQGVFYGIFPPPRYEGAFWEVYFTSQSRPEIRLAELIRGANREVHIASYDLDNPEVVNALVDRKGDIDIKLVTEADNAESWGVGRLRDAGVPLRLDNRRPLMHNKFVVIDDSVVWTGSYNLTQSGYRKNYDNAIVLFAPALAANYEAEFAEMWQGQFGGSSPRNTRPSFLFDSVEVDNYFAPEDGVASHVLSEVLSAKSEILFMIYSFTDKDIARAMIQKHNEGVRVEGIFNWRQKSDKNSVWRLLSGAGVPVYFSPRDKTLHHKVMIIDSSVVITGSYNFTMSANKRNDENLLIIHSPELARAYLEEYNRILERAGLAGRWNRSRGLSSVF